MSRAIEDKAKKYLLSKFIDEKYEFIDRTKSDDVGFDLWLIDKKTKRKQKIELKATKGEFKRKSDLFQKLYFSASNEVENFKKGKTLIARVFLGNKAPKIFLISRSILKKGAKFQREFREKIVGQINYDNSFEELGI
ncbi:hypothetical protein BMS3Abin15_01023 [bacterium BMS3Abin15]|nr:hypothetical protein BMS3Abin15_01023 [bacterium BMS3Abin15]HDZ85149.1 hypothetical protein [Candidatus Moranbacteria bacterium]